MKRDQSFEDVCRLMNLPAGMIKAIDGIQKTSDGYYMLRDIGDVGFNRFLGRPSAPHAGPGRTAMLKVWRALSPERRRNALAAAVSMRINLAREFGVPTSDVEIVS